MSIAVAVIWLSAIALLIYSYYPDFFVVEGSSITPIH